MAPVFLIIIIVGSAAAVTLIFILRSVLAPRKVAGIHDLYKQGKYSAAIKQAKQLLTNEPRNYEVHYLLGLSYLGDGKSELALMEMKKINEFGDFSGILKEVDFRKTIAGLYNDFNQPEEALKEYLLLIRLEPDEPEWFYQAGSLFEYRNKTDSAVQHFKKAIELNPQHTDAHFKLGSIYYRNKRHGEAKTELDLALRYNPENHKANFFIGKMLKDKKDFAGALNAFEKSQRDPELKIKSLLERGICYINVKNYDRAITELERTIANSDNHGQEILFARYFLAHCYEQRRDIDKAIEQWELVYAKKPTFKDVGEKLSQYQDLRTDDMMKDYLTAGRNEFIEICKKLTIAMNMSIRDTSEVQNGCQVIAVDSETKWRGAKKLPLMIWYLRVPELVQEAQTRAIHEAMKKASVSRGMIVTSSGFSRKAREFSESRPVNLISKEKLQAMLKKI
ncbi:MAG: tetratricopeptide repeat protein [Spirochaetales bacterium]|uniref:Tetratricopeptide repeat protein n=1 Tax=Candidatus Thalassospirochaeta sargassi TaxID=3119039 RepID=A0AAJ1IAB8_9SPIO|nr:tetratricopeptide repeat protein [Spirochaetales bacterium]